MNRVEVLWHKTFFDAWKRKTKSARANERFRKRRRESKYHHVMINQADCAAFFSVVEQVLNDVQGTEVCVVTALGE